MTRIAVVFAVVLALGSAFASEPGQPLDCSDFVFLEPGLSCSHVVGPCSGGNGFCAGHGGQEVDAEGNLLALRPERFPAIECGGGVTVENRLTLARLRGATEEILGYIDERCGLPGSTDTLNGGAVGFAPTTGKFFFWFRGTCTGACGYQVPDRLLVVDGFTTTFDVLQTFVPSVSALIFHVPVMPEGMAAADHFDTYWGNLGNPIDFTQAQPLQCDYPAAPQVGDYLTVADTLPNPPAGTGRYYVTAATYQGQTRYGRKRQGTVMSGRDPAVLPACVQPESH